MSGPSNQPNRTGVAGIVAAASLVAFPVTVITVDHVSSGILAILALGGLATLFVGERRPLKAEERHLMLLAAGFVGVAVAAYLIAGRPETGISNLRRYARVLAIVPVYFLLLRARPQQRWLWTGLGLGAIACGLFAMWDAWVVPRPPGYRVTGSTHFIIFGDLSLAMGFMAFAAWLPRRTGPLRGWLAAAGAFAALGLGLVASLLSGTRGAWIAAPAMVLILFWYHWPSIAVRARVAMVVAVLGMTAMVYAVPQTGVQSRVNIAVTEVRCYLEGERCFGASGGRLEMWKAAWRMFRENPVAGVGVGGYRSSARELAAQGEMLADAAVFDHPHSEYFSVLASRGLVGLALLLALFLVPAMRYFRAAALREGVGSRAGLAGLLLVAGFAQFALTESVFERSRFVAFFVIYTAALTYQCLRGEEDAGRKPASGPTTGVHRDSLGAVTASSAGRVPVPPVSSVS